MISIQHVGVRGLELNGNVEINGNSNLLLSGTRTVIFGDTGSGDRIDLEGIGTTTFGSGTTVRGENGAIGGQVFVGGTQTLVNNGTITADVAGGTIEFNESAVTNNGVIIAGAGTTIEINSAFTNALNGVITGSGTVDAPTGALLNEGQVAPGSSPGTLTILGDYIQTLDGILDIEIGTLTNSDLLLVAGSAAVDGTLALHCFDDCKLGIGDSLTILDAANDELSGMFSVSLFGFATGQFDVIDDNLFGDVRLVVTEAVTPAPVPAPAPAPAAARLLLSGMVAVGMRRRGQATLS